MTDSPALSLRTKMLGAMLREARLNAGKSIRETADLLGVGPGTVSSYEHGRKGISLPELEILAYEFDVPTKAFWDDRQPVSQERPPVNARQTIALRDRIVGAQLRLHRTEAGLTIKALAERTGFPGSRISSYERGRRSVPVAELEMLAASLGHTLEEYMNGEGAIGRWARQSAALRRFAELPEELQAFVADPENAPFLELARDLSALPADRLHAIGQAFKDIAP